MAANTAPLQGLRRATTRKVPCKNVENISSLCYRQNQSATIILVVAAFDDVLT
jgi:hypothetical protein